MAFSLAPSFSAQLKMGFWIPRDVAQAVRTEAATTWKPKLDALPADVVLKLTRCSITRDDDRLPVAWEGRGQLYLGLKVVRRAAGVTGFFIPNQSVLPGIRQAVRSMRVDKRAPVIEAAKRFVAESIQVVATQLASVPGSIKEM